VQVLLERQVVLVALVQLVRLVLLVCPALKDNRAALELADLVELRGRPELVESLDHLVLAERVAHSGRVDQVV